MPEQPQPIAPNAPSTPYVRRHHGDEVEDPYHWMADKGDQRLLQYLREENAYTEARTAHLAGLRQSLFDDISARTLQTDLSVPSFVTHTDGSQYWYYTRTTEGLDYQTMCRVPATGRDALPDTGGAVPDEQVILDVNALAEGHSFCTLGLADVSPSGRYLAYSVDTAGDERYALSVVDLATGETLGEPLADVGPGGAWAGDDWVFYHRVDETWRPFEVWRHRVGSPATEDALVVREDDERFWLNVDAARGYEWILIESGSKLTTETSLVPAADPTAEPRCVAPRRQGVDYSVEVGRDELYILHNDGAEQFMLSRAPLDSTGPGDWTTVLPEDPAVRLTGVTFYDAGLVLSHRTDGMTAVSLLRRGSDGALSAPQRLAFDEAVHTVDAADEADLDADRIRLHYESLVTPPEVIEYRLGSGERAVLKRTPVLDHPQHGPYDPAAYVTERSWATAPDGVHVPVSIVRRADVARDGTAPCLLYGYGSYEYSTEPTFAISRLSLLDRGFVFAIAHVRGGGELGRPWYDDGKMLAKKNSFSDFVAVGRHLVEAGYTGPDRLAAEGGSAGGLLMGAAINLAPDLFRAVHAAVPFVDALTTILDPELPLTVVEWEEWGDPLHDPEVYAYMKSYSPYENIASVPYPAILATTSLNDTRVEVTEPAKWVARLRDTVPDDPQRPIMLRTEMVAGHGGVSGRYEAWRQRAFELAWLIDQLTGPAAG
ncbi:S9 family peptidase [Nigerium massiliense]|uniref:S9 family peptidase n=1 Tax=Nigerium massiliense TaxID=1522317 RepID=UPI00058DD8C9|nr:S9 family peptidase [Nigerium massiliense]